MSVEFCRWCRYVNANVFNKKANMCKHCANICNDGLPTLQTCSSTSVLRFFLMNLEYVPFIKVFPAITALKNALVII